MKKTIFASILAIILIICCVSCSYGVKPTGASATADSSAEASVNPSADASSSGTATATATASASPSSTPQPEPVFTTLDTVEYNSDAVIFDLSNPLDLPIVINATGIKSIQLSGSTLSTWNFSFESNLLRVPQDVFSSKNAGVYSLIVTDTSDAVTTCKVYIATNVITTPQEFQDINDNLGGIYVLGKDLDFTGFQNEYFSDLGLIPNLSYFQPIGCDGTNTSGAIGSAFTGALYGMGHTISNLMVDSDFCSPVYEEHVTNTDWPYFDDDAANSIGIFMRTSSKAKIDGVCFKDCSVKISGIIVGMVVSVNNGTISNVVVDGGTVTGGSLHLDLNCFFAGFVAMNGATGKISNCISTVSAINGDPWAGKLTRSFAGKTWGEITDSYASSDGLTLDDFTAEDEVENFGNQYVNITDTGNHFTYTAIEVQGGTPMELGSFVGCDTKTIDELRAGTAAEGGIYSTYDTDIWDINGTDLPSLKIISTRP